jgi:GxxExxY protein
MRKCGLGAVQQRGIVVRYDDVIVGELTADLLVEDQVIVELKVVGALSDVHIPQSRNLYQPPLMPTLYPVIARTRRAMTIA